MANVVVSGAGMNGLTMALLLAKDGHSVTVIERDPAPPPRPDEAWDTWERRGVNQFRMLHYLQPRWREIVEAELPDVVEAFDRAGALRFNPLELIPPEMIGGVRDGDAASTALTARRPVAESATASVVDATPGILVRRGVPIQGLATGTATADGVPHVTGVVTESGEVIAADLVIDATGRRSPLTSWLEAVGARPPIEIEEDLGFQYYGRHFQSTDGSLPAILGGPLQPYDSVSILTLPADNGTWGVGVITSGRDADLRKLKDNDTWSRVVRSYPLVAHWLDAEPLDDVAIMARIPDRYRRFVVDGAPVATGVVAVGDAWACTNPSLGRGITMGLMHAVALRDLLRTDAFEDPYKLALAWDDTTEAVVTPWYDATLSFDRNRLAEITAQIAGDPYEPGDPAWEITKALFYAAGQDGDILRRFLRTVGLQRTIEETLAEPGFLDKVIEVGSDWRSAPAMGPTRRELLDLVNVMRADSGGVGIEYDVSGPEDGRPVVLVHGFPDTGRLWRNQVPALAQAGLRVIVPDMRGYGRSDKPGDIEAYNLLFLAGDVFAVLDDLGIERAAIVGHDWGAAVAWGLAAMGPDRVDRMAALSVGHPAAFRLAGLPQQEKSWYMLLFQFPDVAEQWLSENGWTNLREWSNHPDVDSVIADLERDRSLTPALNWYRANVPPEAWVGPGLELPPVQAPTMGVWSSGDFALLESQMTGSAQFCAGEFRYERIEGPGHWMQLEAPDEVNDLLVDFLT